MNNNQVAQGGILPNPGPGWSTVDAQDYNHDGRADILWRGADGTVVEWFMNGLQGGEANLSIPNAGAAWTLLGI